MAPAAPHATEGKGAEVQFPRVWYGSGYAIMKRRCWNIVFTGVVVARERERWVMYRGGEDYCIYRDTQRTAAAAAGLSFSL